MKGQLQGFVWLALAVHLTGCDDHDEVGLSLTKDPIAAGAYLPLNVSDGCRSGGKINFCTSEAVVSIDTIDVADPSVVAILRMEELTEAQQVTAGQLVIDAKHAGTTSVTIESTFDDGTKRTATEDVTVADIDLVRLFHACSVKAPEDEQAIPVGRSVPMWAKVFHGETELRGEYQDTLLEGEGLASKFGGLTSNSFVFTAAEAGTAEITSPVAAAFSKTLRSFTPDEATIGAVELQHEAETSYLDFIGFDVDVKVDGRRPCFYPPLRVETQTPEICDGKAGATSWVEDSPGYGISLRALHSGTCKFTLAIEGNDQQPYVIETPLKVTDEPAPDPCESVTCEPVTSCEAGHELVHHDCCNFCEPQANPALCETQRQSFDELFEPQLEQANACTVDRDCMSVVLIGGCRRYCFVATNQERTADFMNAISEPYYTSCSSCQAGVPADCEGDGRAICQEGHCTLAAPAEP